MFNPTGPGGSPGESEVHISYHNGDHYNSVRRIGDPGNTPSKLRLCLSNTSVNNCDNYRGQDNEDLSDSGQESDYENSPSSSKLNKLGKQNLLSPVADLNSFISAGEVANLAGVDVKREVFDALEMNAYCVTSAVDYLINVRQPPYGAFDWVTLLISFAGLICLTFSFAIWIILIIFVMY